MAPETLPTGGPGEGLPAHLRRHVVAQDYGAYTPRDHAVWRHVLHALVRHLADRAHPAYVRGLAATGIGLDRIPRLEEMNARLAALGWAAVPVRGFIPPAVFTELQSRRVLAIACDIRSHAHVAYTPAPDVIHESAGHAPIIADPEYASFLQEAGELGFRAIASAEEAEVYEAVRALSVVKEDPLASPAEVAAAERRLAAANAAVRVTSEAARASRLYWWTAEYGLVGDLDRPRIYGAGLLSSIGESTHCLSDDVERRPLTVEAADVAFDITRMQPQLFVVPELGALHEVVERVARTFSFRRGGDHGLREALRGRTVNHLALSGGREVSGVVAAVHPGLVPAAPGLATAVAVLSGPTLLSRGGVAQGAPRDLAAVVAFGRARATTGGEGPFSLTLSTGLALTGRVQGGVAHALRGRLGSRELELPTEALLLLSDDLRSVGGGAADPGAWEAGLGAPPVHGEAEARARARKAAELPRELAILYGEVRAMRERGALDRARLQAIAGELGRFDDDWLLALEVEELLAGTATVARGDAPGEPVRAGA